MRFDDMIETVLAQPHVGGGAAITAYRQLVDLLAQGRAGRDNALAVRAYERLGDLSAKVPPEVRRGCISAVTGRRIAPDLLVHFARENLGASAPLIASARLTVEEWIAILPVLPPAARNILRSRRDVDERVRVALEAYGHSDLVLAAPVIADDAVAGNTATAAMTADDDACDDDEPDGQPMPPQAEVAGPQSQVSLLLRRIEARRAGEGAETSIDTGIDASDDDEEEQETEADVSADWSPEETFRWESNAEGVIVLVEGFVREGLVGRSLVASEGALTTAFSRRAPFRNGDMMVRGRMPAAGPWLLSGVPFFDPREGRFGGFRGIARRPSPMADGPAAATEDMAGMSGNSDAPGTMDAQTALINIRGLVAPEVALMGAHAGAGDGTSAASQVAQWFMPVAEDAAPVETVDAISLLDGVAERQNRLLAGEAILVRQDEATPAKVAISAELFQRLVERLLAGVAPLARPGEKLGYGVLPAENGKMRLYIARPSTVIGRSARALCDPAATGVAVALDPAVLGLGFALRMTQKLASALPGDFAIEGRRFVLSLPMAAVQEGKEGNIMKNGGPGGIRTPNQAVMSGQLYP